MSDIYVCEVPKSDGPARPTLLFCMHDLALDRNQRELKRCFHRLVVDRWVGSVWLLVPKPFLQGAIEAVERILPAVWPEPLRTSPHEYCVFTFDAAGAVTQGFGSPTTPDWTLLRQDVLSKLLVTRHGILRATPAYHFEKPNKRHAAVLIRAANLLLEEAEIGMIAFFLLPFTARECREVWMDSASLFPLGYSLSQLRRTLDPQMMDLRIASFRSHEGLGQAMGIAGRGRESLWVVSASATGGLAKRIRADGRSGVVTLFQESSGLGDAEVLCTVSLGDLGGRRQSECALCRSYSLPIAFEPDLFIPLRPSVTPHLPKVDTLPGGPPAALIRELGATDSILVHYADPSAAGAATGAHEVWIDALKFAEHNRLEGWLRSRLPVGLGGITYVEDPASEHMAMVAHSLMPGLDPPKAAVDAAQLDPCRPVAVMASVLVDGRRLSAVAQRLRKHKDSGGVSWFIDFCRVPTDEEFEQIRNALTQGRSGTDLFHVRQPRLKIPDRRQGAWHTERDLLDVEDALRAEFNSRSDGLHSESGLTGDELFLPDLHGRPLALRDNSFLGDRGTSQAAIFLRVNHWLHSLRHQKVPSLSAGYLSWTVLEPHLFDRFNDGVIQAALLRAALPHELNYASEPVSCAAMIRKLENVLVNAHEEQGEASLEFLLALATRRLCVGDLEPLFERISRKKPRSSPAMRALMDVAQERSK